MSDKTITSQHMNEVDQLILRAAKQVLDRTARNVTSGIFSADMGTAEILNIGSLRERLETAENAVSRALIALEVNAEHCPPAKPASLRVAP